MKIMSFKSNKLILFVFGMIILFGTILVLGILNFGKTSETQVNEKRKVPGKESVEIRDSFKPSSTGPEDTQIISLYLVSLGDEGVAGEEFGCEDSLVSVDRQVVSGEKSLIETAVKELISINPDKELNSDLYNAFSNSRLKVESVTVENGMATIRLNGELKLGGVCDNPRIKEQLRRTVLQFSSVNDINIFINEETLDDILPGR